MTKTTRNILPPNSNLDDEIFEALKENDWLIPQTVAEVLRAELELNSIAAPALPAELANARQVLARASRPLRLAKPPLPVARAKRKIEDYINTHERQS